MKKPFYITTAIAYASKKPHVGNTYDPILVDAIARYKRLQGYDVYFLTGTDEHGQKIENYANEEGISPKEYVDGVSKEIKDLWDAMDTSYDQLIRTTDPKHVKSVQHIFKKLYEQGDIYKGNYEGWYCVPDESFFTEAQLVDGKCPDCGRDVHYTKEEAYFMRTSNYADRLLEYYEENADFILPTSRKAEMVNNFIKPGLQDLCVSRTSFSWGIPVDFDPGHVVYVWIDALANYITSLGYDPDLDEQPELFQKYWPADLHVIGKDILRFHTIYWPIILMALDVPLPKSVLGHSWYLSGNDKMSKSVGNVIYADDLATYFGVDGVRFYLLANMPYTSDGNITYENVLATYNTDLANTIGNLLSRSIAMTVKYFDGIVPVPQKEDSALTMDLKNVTRKCSESYVAHMDSYHLADAISDILTLARRLNKYIDETEPWNLAKDPAKKEELGTVLYNLLEGIRHLGIMLLPIIPSSAEKMLAVLHVTSDSLEGLGDFDGLKSGTQLENIEPLFARLDEEKTLKQIQEDITAKANLSAPKEEKLETPVGIAQIGIEDFQKVALRSAKVLSCEAVPKSDKLLCLSLDDGSGIPRQVVSGIAPWYEPEDLVEKTIIVVANLKSAKLRGVESQGMILAADVEDGVQVVFLNDNVLPGSVIR